MNRYALSAESKGWWLPSAAAGLATAGAIAAILLVPVTTTYAASSEPRNEGSAVSAPLADDTAGTKRHPCFMLRANWNPGLDGKQPWCVTRVHGADSTRPQVKAAAHRGLRQLDVGV